MLGDERPGYPEGNADEHAQDTGRTAVARSKKLKETVEQPGITMADVLTLIGQMNEQNQTNMIAAIAEMKKPTAAEQAKLDKEEAKIKAQQESRLKLAMADEQRRPLNMSGCTHSTVHAGTGVTKHAWRAQVHTPHGEKPYFIPTCIINQCQLKDKDGRLIKFYATPEMLTQGVNLDAYQGLDVERLKAWAAQSQVA